VSNSDVMVRFGADIEPLKKGAKQASIDLDKVRGKVNLAAKAMGGMAVAAAAMGAAMVKSGLESVDAQAKLAAQLKTTSADLATLSRAFDMSGVSQEQLQSGARQLTLRLSQAASGTGAAKDALDRLKLTTDDLARMPLSERIATLNSRIKDMVPATEQAAISAQFFGDKAGIAFSQVSADTIGQAASEVEKLGLAISEVDAAKVEAANDAISRAGMASKAMTQQMAIQFAPVLQGITDLWFDNATGANKARDAAAMAFNAVIKGAGLAGNSIRGIQVIVKGLEVAFHGFSVVVNTILAAIPASVDWVINSAKASINSLIEGMNRLPKVNLTPLEIGASRATQIMEGVAQTAKNNMTNAMGELHDLMMRPLPSDALDDWVEQVTNAANKAAEAAAQAKAENMGLAIPEIADPADDPQARAEVDRQKYIAAQYRNYAQARVESEKEAKAEIAETQSAFGTDSLNAYSKMFGNLATLMNSENRKQFEIGKKAAAAQTIVDTYASAQSAFKSLSGIPIVGPALGAAAAGAAVVSGLARLSAINSTSFGSKSASPPADAPAPSAPAAGGGSSGGGGSSSTLFVEGIDPTAMFSGEVMRNFAQKLIEFQQDGGQVVLT
jgi:hypothetical protein